MKVELPNGVSNEQFLSRMFYLLYQASSVMGMGAFQARNGATEDQVWKNVIGMEDYPGRKLRDGYFNADYVFGRMMKFNASLSKDGVIELRDGPYRADYQSWCHTYPTPESIVKSTLESLKRP